MKKIFIFVVSLIVHSQAYSMVSFEACLKEVPACKKLNTPVVHQHNMDLKSFLDSINSKTEKEKYDCVLKNTAGKPLDLSCEVAVQHYEFHLSCRDDILKHCSKIIPGDGRIRVCLEKQKHIRSSCKQKFPKLEEIPLDEMPKHMGGASAC